MSYNLPQLFRTSVVLLSLLAAPLANAKPATTSTPTHQISARLYRQINGAFGSTSLYVSKEGVKFLGREGDLCIVSRAPTWKVVAYNVGAKRAMQFTLEEWRKNHLSLMGSRVSMKKGTKSEAYDSLLKIKVTQITAPSGMRFYGSNDPSIFRAAGKKFLKQAVLRVSQEPNMGPEVKAMIEGLYRQPDYGGVPLELSNEMTDGSFDKTYGTAKINQTTVADSFYDYPTDCKATTDTMEFMISGKQKKKMEELFDVLKDEAEEIKAHDSRSGKSK